MKYLLPLFLLMLALVACAPEEALPTAVSVPLSPTNPPATIAVEPTAELAELEEVAEVAEVVEANSTEQIMGRTAEGAFYMGNPDAPVKMLDYSNFL